MERLSLDNPVHRVPLVGPTQTKKLKKLKIETVEDLLHHYPSRYEDFSQIKKIASLIFDEPATIRGQLLKIENIYTRRGKHLTKALVADETGQLLLVWFNQPYIVKNLKKGNLVSLSGRLSKFDGKPAFVSPEYEAIRNQTPNSQHQTIHTGRLIPIYPETKGITSKWLRSRINAVLQTLKPTLDDHLPEKIKKEKSLLDLKKALESIHFPKNKKDLQEAKRRLAFDELFLIQMRVFLRKRRWEKRRATATIAATNYKNQIGKFLSSLPFELTAAQKRCAGEIFKDLGGKKPMNRLLQGDVGSGKTIVAVLAIYITHLAGHKSLYMAPTEVLAKQQHQSLRNLLEPFGIKAGLLTGSTKLAGGGDKIDVVVGTHALLHHRKPFPKTALVIIDEQHRFGVEQRARLLKEAAGRLPHLLTMTATPIPRSLSLTLYGDLDISIIDEMPKGRKKVKTWVVPQYKRETAYGWIRKQILAPAKKLHLRGAMSAERRRSQAFIIYPLIEESEAETLKSVRAVKSEFKRLESKVFPDLRLGLLHGRMKAKEKEAIIEKFRRQKLDILLSTPVVEVGVDIPNATIMMIEGAERFGLASLHQLRGRVGRREKPSFCLLFSNLPQRGKHLKRLKILENHFDGRALAEADLKLRGPGDFYGTRQHGFMDLKMAHPADIELIKTTKEAVEELFKKSPQLDKHPKLRDKLKRIASAKVEPN